MAMSDVPGPSSRPGERRARARGAAGGDDSDPDQPDKLLFTRTRRPGRPGRPGRPAPATTAAAWSSRFTPSPTTSTESSSIFG